MGEACLWADKYHTRKVCQERISQDLIDGEFSSILASLLGFLPSLDHFIRSREKVRRKCQSDLFRCLEVYDEFKLHRLLHRQISRFGTLQDLVHVNSRAPIEVNVTRPVTGLAGLKGGIMPRSTAQNLENILIDALEYYQEEEGAKIKTRTYSDVGMLTTDRGLVVTLPDGSQFQVTIVQSR